MHSTYMYIGNLSLWKSLNAKLLFGKIEDEAHHTIELIYDRLNTYGTEMAMNRCRKCNNISICALINLKCKNNEEMWK